MYKVFSPNDSKVAMKVIPGHFVTTHSHITHYVDMTTLRARQNEAEAAARILTVNILLRRSNINGMMCIQTHDSGFGQFLCKVCTDHFTAIQTDDTVHRGIIGIFTCQNSCSSFRFILSCTQRRQRIWLQ